MPLGLPTNEGVKLKVETEIDYAARWLKANLTEGPQLSKILKLAAAERGIAERTLWRAKKMVGVKSFKKTQANGPWFWELIS